MATFYEALKPFYDDIFPTNGKQIQFLASRLSEGRLLDVGAGTGNAAIALAEKGFQVTAMEPEEEMREEIRRKTESRELSIIVAPNKMQQIGELEGVFEGIYCVGNTLVHLHDLDEIAEFIAKVNGKLNEHGKLIIQIVNYDKVLASRDFTFPVVSKERFLFKRSYQIKDGKVLFNIELTADGVRLAESTELFPLTEGQLLSLLEINHFSHVKTYGSFDGEHFSSEHSPALIVIAEKAPSV